MGRRAAKALHLALFLFGVALYVVFVLPRWWVLTGDIPTAVATAGRIAAGIPIALAALPVLAILRLALDRKAKTPELALRLRAWSAVLHVVAGALILVTAVVEIWLRLAVGGPYLFAVYGAAGAIAILGALALYLSFVAEKPPVPPKPPKPPKPAKVKKVKAAKAAKSGKLGMKKAGAESGTGAQETAESEFESEHEPEGGPESGSESPSESGPADADTSAGSDEGTIVIVESDETPDTATVVGGSESETGLAPGDAEPVSTGVLRNKRPAGRRHRLRR